MWYLFLVILALGLSALMSALETATYAANHLRLSAAERANNPAASSALAMVKNLPQTLSTILIGNNFANMLGTQFFAYYLLASGHDNAALLTTVILTPFFFFFGENIPKRYAYRHADNFILRAQLGFTIIKTILSPFTFLLNLLNDAGDKLLDKLGYKPARRDERALLIENLESSYHGGHLSETQISMASRVMEIESRQVSAAQESPQMFLQIPENTPAYTAGRLLLQRQQQHALLIDERKNFTGMAISLSRLIDMTDKTAPVKEFARSVPRFYPFVPVVKAIDKMRKIGAPLAFVERCSQRSPHIVGVISLNKLIGYVVRGLEKHEW